MDLPSPSGPSFFDIVATALFALAILHTFCVKIFEHRALKYPHGSIGENLFHTLGEIEVVFGLWAGVFFLFMIATQGAADAIHSFEKLNYTEPAFVFVIMTIAATRPVIFAAGSLIHLLSRLIPATRSLVFFVIALILGPILGSFITEPAAMTVTALILKEHYFDQGISNRLKYATLGALFVNISIGGTLTHFAAPPVLMVASVWNWDTLFMFSHFGWKSIIAVFINTILVTLVFRKELLGMNSIGSKPEKDKTTPSEKPVPFWLVLIHLIFLAAVVFTAHHPVIFIGFLLFFLGIAKVTAEHQTPLKLQEALLVGFFLGGLVVLGGPQRWWLEPLLARLDTVPLFLGATSLTAFTDNAALTYLGAQVEGITDVMKYSLVAGAVAGGGLTVIANAPNPAGFGILKSSFGEEGISPMGLLLGAAIPTLVSMACLWFLPHL